MKLTMAIIMAILLTFSSAIFARPTRSDVTRFEFADYEGEGVFTMYRLDANVKTRQVNFCFVNSDAVGKDMPKDLPAIVYRGGTWSGHFDFDHAEGKMCFDTEFAVGQDWFSSPTPMRYVDGNDYQFFFIGELKQETGHGGRFLLDGKLNVFVWEKNMDAGMRAYARQVMLHEKSVREK